MIDYNFTYANLEYFLLIFIRMTGFVAAAPLFGQNNGLPNIAKVGFSFLTAMLLVEVVPRPVIEYTTVFGYAAIVIKEVLTGLIIGLGAQICMSITAFAGHIVDMQTGLSMVTMMDPTTNESITISGSLYQYAITLLLLISGFYQYLVRAIADSYTLIPVNGAVFHADRFLTSATTYLTNYIVIGFRIALPIFVVTFILNFILGILAKVAPQLNMFSVGMQIKILVGLAVLYMTMVMLKGAADFIFTQMKEMMEEMVISVTP